MTLQGHYSIKSSQRVKWFSLSPIICLKFSLSFSRVSSLHCLSPRTARVSMALLSHVADLAHHALICSLADRLCPRGSLCRSPRCFRLVGLLRPPLTHLPEGGEKWYMPEERQWRELLSQRCFFGALPSLPSVCPPPAPAQRFFLDGLSQPSTCSELLLLNFFYFFFLYFYLFVAPPFHSDIEFTGGRHSEKLQKQIESPWLFLSKNFLFLIGGKLLSSIVLCCTIM